MALAAEFAEHRHKLAGKAGVVERLAEPLGAAAGAHVEAVRGKARPQGDGAEALHIAGLSRALQAMDHHNFARRLSGRPLRFHEHLNARLSLDEPALDGKSVTRRPLPIVARDGLQVRISEERPEGNHESLRNL